MKQLLQDIRTGDSLVLDVPEPDVQPGRVLIRTAASLVSAGTERMVVEFAGKSLIDKARARPDLVRQVVDKARREGVLTTYDAIRTRLDQPMALGYSSAGIVIDVPPDVSGFAPGDRVAAAGGGFAVHAEVVSVPVNLVVKLPAAVELVPAAFTTLAAIALQGVRLADLQLGATAAVVGLGLLGQLSVRLLRAAGVRVLGMDPRPERAAMAAEAGAEMTASDADRFAAACRTATGGFGVDAVLLTADTPSDEPVALAGEIARDRGVVVAVGAVGTRLPRKPYYEKELDFRVSRSYGPGRYDADYEERGRDYPYGYVRWTENRNMQAIVALMADGRLDVTPLISHRIPIAEAARAYDVISGKTGEPFLGVVLTFPEAPAAASPSRVIARGAAADGAGAPVRVGLVGAGNFAKATLLPAMAKLEGLGLEGVCAASGLTARHVADRHGFRYAATRIEDILADQAVTVVAIATRHDRHADQVVQALGAGKHVFVEKPLCLTPEELARIRAAQAASGRTVMVGFNRRFAPLAQRLQAFMAGVGEPLHVLYRVNAGQIPRSHWTQGPEGGGRLLGEVVHFLDWGRWLCASPARSVYAAASPDVGQYNGDNLQITVRFASGSLLHIAYLANGDRSAGKERIEVHGGGRTAVLDDYRSLELVRGGRRTAARQWLRQDKGHRGEWQALVAALRDGGPPPIPFDEQVEVMETAFAAIESLRTGAAAAVPGAGRC